MVKSCDRSAVNLETTLYIVILEKVINHMLHDYHITSKLGIFQFLFFVFAIQIEKAGIKI